MIKWAGFGKLLKQSFFTLLISCFILLGSLFVSADFSIGNMANIGTYTDTLGGNKITVLKNGILNSTNSGGTINKNILVFSDTSYTNAQNKKYFWFNNGYAYFYRSLTGYSYTSNLVAGKFTKYFLCDPLNGSTVSNCSVNDYGNGDNLKNFFNSIDITDKYGFKVQSTNQNTLPLIVCFSSDSYGKSVCFDNSSNSYYETISMEANLTFDNFPLSSIGNPPGVQNGGSSAGSITGSINNNITGDTVDSYCTYGDIIDYAETFGYNINLCYGGLDNFTDYDSSLTYNPIPGTGKSLGQILVYSAGAWDSPVDWFNYWNGLYIDRYSNPYNAMWESYPAVNRTWFDLYYKYGGSDLNFDAVREYCIMKDLDIDLSSKYNGTYFRNTCQTIISIGGGNGQGGGVILGDDVAVGVNWNGVGNISGQNESKSALNFIQDFFNKSRSTINTGFTGSTVGFLPKYIVMFLLAIILFRFLRH